MTASLDRSACEMVEAAPRRLPWIAIAVERDDRIAGHDAADACHPNTSVGGGNIIATFARGSEAQFVVIAAAALQDAALCRFERANQRRPRRPRVQPGLRHPELGHASCRERVGQYR